MKLRIILFFKPLASLKAAVVFMPWLLIFKIDLDKFQKSGEK